MSRPRISGAATRCRLDASIHVARASLASRRRLLAAYDELLAGVYHRSTMLSRRGPTEGPDVVAGLVALAHHASDWLRRVATWSCDVGSPWVQFASLAEHLLARFRVPRFMVAVWLQPLPDARLQQDWYKRLGRGESIRRLGLPIRITRAMAHRFTGAPHHLTPTGALRWAQVVAMGGSRALAAAVCATRLGRELRNEDFWETVVRFFVDSPELETEHVGPIVEYLHHQRFGGDEGMPAPSPRLEIKGRTVSSLRDVAQQWCMFRTVGVRAMETWQRSAYGEASWTEHAVRRQGDAVHTEEHRWSLEELCSSSALRKEGIAMHNCVARYVGPCVAGVSSIWSMRVVTPLGQRHLLTVEVDPRRRRVCQVRRPFNARPSEEEIERLKRWAAREGLEIGSSAW